MTTLQVDDAYALNPDGIHVSRKPVSRRDQEYDEAWFEILLAAQSRHFWYTGRQRFLLYALQQHLEHLPIRENGVRAIDLGGGSGGWIACLKHQAGIEFSELALLDSSLCALKLSSAVLGPTVRLYQADLLNLGWRDRWDVVFLLDVLEHLPADREALAQIHEALRPGGLLFVTVPALRCFWSYNDEVVGHKRRYAPADLSRLAGEVGLRCCDIRYFMFVLSPLLWITRWASSLIKMDETKKRALAERAHRLPPTLINKTLAMLFAAETPLGHWLRFPWGTSILGVFQKPC